MTLNEAISRQAAIDALDEIEAEVADGYGYQYAKWREYFVEMPSAQPKRKTGHWINSYKRQTCSICKQRGYRSWNFCPNCGADMKGDTYE